MDVCKNVDKYAQFMQKQRRMLQDAKSKQGQRPQDRKDRDKMLFEFMMASMSTVQMSGRATNNGEQHVQSSFVPPAYPPCTTPLDDLKPIMIEDLRLETHHRGRYLTLRAITPPNRMTAILVIAEDERGDVTLLQMYQQEDETSHPAVDVVDKGSILIVKEPFFKVTASGDYSLRVDHLSDIIFLTDEETMTPTSWKPRLLEMSRTAESLKLEGNTLIGKERYWRAIEKYSDVLAQTATSSEVEVIRRNRSLAYLKTKQYDAALADTGYPSFSGEPSEKGMFRAAEALYHLTRYDESRQTLEKLCEHFPANKEAAATLTRAQRRCAESSTGEYDFKLLQAEAKKHHPPHLDHATYVGPLEVRKVKGKGRGLFLTKPAKVGDLLLCEKAFSHAHVDEERKGNANISLLMNVETDKGFLGGQADLIQLITQKMFKNSSTAPTFTDLYHGDYEAVDAKSVDGQPIVDTFLVERTMTLNVFGSPITSLNSYKRLKDNKESKEKAYHSCGIWIKASYINHSCLGNVRRSFIGDMMIVRAKKDMEAGTELSFPYEAPDGHYTSKVDQKFKNWGFVCNCPLCEDIKSTKASEVTKRRTLLEQLERLCKSTTSGNAFNAKFERLLKALNETYSRPVEEVPRLLLWDPQLLLTRIYMRQPDLTKGLESVEKIFQSLGFTVTGLDRTSAAFLVTRWGHIVDHLVEAFLHARSAFEQSKLGDKAKQADHSRDTDIIIKALRPFMLGIG
ncbi:uncharacterized protein J4E88_010970 [Alternaria novae-zelandiae]|uniref:uncharacterized protein n=1 Tax=Alternaria novae-zelandiae TaxID=430562 RepID=UPI0020C3D1A2|nr:uncharacterized protein J4E88_010970 [Alternaria novae-zelandiae]KAI4661522.1 hypothetical protein J4E88_010970 [Alternaria novae-zelandiae]